MKRVVLAAVTAALLMSFYGETQAYHVIKQHRQEKPKVAVEQIPAKAPEVAKQEKIEFSATAQGKTDRALIKGAECKAQSAGKEELNKGAEGKGQGAGVESISAPVLDPYLMCPGDQVQINVFGFEDVTGSYIVRPDGLLTLPLIGNIQVAGRTVEENAAIITEKLSEYLIDPQVTLNITGLGTTRVYVFGEITGQGTKELTKSHTLVDAIGAAGGFSKKSAKKCVYVLRKNQPFFLTKVNMMELFKKNDQSCNPRLQEGDIVYIASNHKLSFSDVFGYLSVPLSTMSNALNIRDRWNNK